MAEDVSSMEVEGVWRDFGLVAGIVRVKDELKEAAASAKNFAAEIVRAEATAKALTVALGAISLGGLTALILQGPRVSAELSRMHTYLELIGIEMDDNVGPAIEFVADQTENLYHWFKDLPESIQSVIAWVIIFAGGIAGLAGTLKLLGLGAILEKFGFLKGLLPIVTGFVTYLSAALFGLWLGIQGVKVLDDLGVLTKLAEFGEKLRESGEWGEFLMDSITLLLAPLLILGNYILALAGLKEWDTIQEAMDKITDAAGRMLSKLEKLDPYFEKFGLGGIGEGSLAMRTGPAAAKNQTVTVTNNFGDVNLASGLDMDSFLTTVNESQAENVKWSEMS